MSAAKRFAHLLLRGVAQTHLGPWIVTRARTAPIWMKMPAASRAAGAIASHIPSAPPFADTNLGIADHLRVRVPAEKHALQFGRPSHAPSERATLDLALILSRASSAFIDVGANEGLFTFSVACSAEAAGRHCSIHAFEPDPALYARLADNLTRNGVSATLNNIALSDHVGQQQFHRNLSSDLMGSLNPDFAEGHQTVAIDVEVTTLAHYMQRADVRTACVKIDVEGAGAIVWRGTEAAIDRIDWLLMEMITPEIQAGLPRRIIETTGWHAYYIRDYDLVPSRMGEFDYHPPFYNWLFCPRAPAALTRHLAGTPFRVLAAPNEDGHR